MQKKQSFIYMHVKWASHRTSMRDRLITTQNQTQMQHAVIHDAVMRQRALSF